ncbi:MAG: hypothetical protein ACP5SP_07875 [Caldisericum sp.]|uniref:hypothetical protein n=1 Tax=Caldisericum sp. TaxID=2499687 RepID=UPI003D140F8B
MANCRICWKRLPLFYRDTAPQEYWNKMTSNLTEEEKAKFLRDNCLPSRFYEMDYKNFLEARRKLMADAIKKYFEKLRGTQPKEAL